MKILFNSIEDAEKFIDTLTADGTAAEELITNLIDKGHKYLDVCKQINDVEKLIDPDYIDSLYDQILTLKLKAKEGF